MSVKLTELKEPRLEASEPRLEARDPRLLPEDTVRVLADRLKRKGPELLGKQSGDRGSSPLLPAQRLVCSTREQTCLILPLTGARLYPAVSTFKAPALIFPLFLLNVSRQQW